MREPRCVDRATRSDASPTDECDGAAHRSRARPPITTRDPRGRRGSPRAVMHERPCVHRDVWVAVRRPRCVDRDAAVGRRGRGRGYARPVRRRWPPGLACRRDRPRPRRSAHTRTIGPGRRFTPKAVACGHRPARPPVAPSPAVVARDVGTATRSGAWVRAARAQTTATGPRVPEGSTTPHVDRRTRGRSAQSSVHTEARGVRPPARPPADRAVPSGRRPRCGDRDAVRGVGTRGPCADNGHRASRAGGIDHRPRRST